MKESAVRFGKAEDFAEVAVEQVAQRAEDASFVEPGAHAA